MSCQTTLNHQKGEEIIFPFPFPPYDIQKSLMSSIFKRLQTGGVGIFESPTGTGKSLSIINSALLWLKCYAPPNYDVLAGNRKFEQNGKAIAKVPAVASSFNSSDDEEPDWATQYESAAVRSLRERHEFAEKRWQARILALLQNAEGSDNLNRKRGRWSRGHHKGSRASTKSKLSKKVLSDNKQENSTICDDENDDEFLVDAYDSDDGVKEAWCTSSSSSDADGFNSDDDDTPLSVRKVIYCTRTHSQLSQFMSEVRETTFGNPVGKSRTKETSSIIEHSGTKRKLSSTDSSIEPLYVRCMFYFF